jgi:hypothetical protein
MRARLRLRFPWFTALAVCAAASFSGCSGFQTFDLPAESAHTRTDHQEKQGLTIAALLLPDQQSVKNHFGPDLRKAGFLPALVFIENRGESSFEIQRKDFGVILESGERFEPVSPDEVFSTVRKSTLPALVFAPLIVPAILLHNDLEQYNFKVARTLHEKSFPRTLRIEKGDAPITRAIFFRDPNGPARSERQFDSSVLEVKVEVEGTRPTDAGDAPRTGDETAQPVAAAESGKGPAARRAESMPVVGKLVTFTVSLSLEDS